MKFIRSKTKQLMGWGVLTEGGAEIWDAEPVFKGETVTVKDKFMLLFHPKKFLLYHYVLRHFIEETRGVSERALISDPFRVLDVGCGMGASIVDMKKLLGKHAEVVGLDVVQLQVDMAKARIKQHGVWPKIRWYDGVHIPFANDHFDVTYASDVLGHVEHVPRWLEELHRVTKPGGLAVMFSESKLGKHAFIRNYFMRKGLNVDPHKEFHISLYSKKELKELFDAAGFDVEVMYSSFWAKFFVHPDELYPALQNQHKFFFWRMLNRALYFLKKKTHPFSAACAELYGLIEMVTIGRWIETQGYVIRARKR